VRIKTTRKRSLMLLQDGQ